MPKSKEINFETTLKDLTEIIEQLEKGGLSLEKSLEYFERGVQLTRLCQKTLTEAEQRVKILTEEDNLQPFDLE